MRCENRECKGKQLSLRRWWLRPHGAFKGPVRVTSWRCAGCGYREMSHQVQRVNDSGQEYLTPAAGIHPDYFHHWDGAISTHRDSMAEENGLTFLHTQVTASIEAKKNFTGLVPVY